jgi:deoxyribose-phosphate aldolase
MIVAAHISGPKELARFIDCALLRADATKDDVARVCAEAREHGVGSVCVNTSRIAQTRHLLEDSAVKVIAAIGFPLGAMDSDAKRYEAEVAVDNDAHQLEVVANIGRIKDGDHACVLRELRDVVEAADDRSVSVAIEIALLTRQEIETSCELVVESGAKAVVTLTGFEAGRDVAQTSKSAVSRVSKPASQAGIDDLQLIKIIVGEKFGIKAAGVRDASMALALIEAGATRIGTTDLSAILQSWPPGTT